MHPQEISTTDNFQKIFNHLELVKKSEAQEILGKVKELMIKTL
jgi:hypothetical protein